MYTNHHHSRFHAFGLRFAVLATLVVASSLTQVAHAIQASPLPVSLRQSDGSEITLHIRGDEFFNWHEDPRGHTVVLNNGSYVYATLDAQGNLAPTSLLVGRDDPAAAGLSTGILPSLEARQAQAPPLMAAGAKASAPAAILPLGAVKNLVVLCQFSDHTPGVHTRAPADYDVLFNTIGGDPILAPTGSVKDLFLENSYGLLTLDSTVVVWVTLPNTEAYYANGTSGLGGSYPANPQGMVEDALNLVDPFVNFSLFDDDLDTYVDAITIIHSGYAAETGGGGGNWIWSHRWSLWALPGSEWTSAEGVKVYNYHTEAALWGTSGTDILRIGVIAHETGHFFGLPDLYDTDHSGNGIGSYGMMANSWGFDGTQYYPPHFSAWSKVELLWAAVTVISTDGTYIAPQVEFTPTIFRIDYGFPPNEYLLIENRQPVGFETAMPQGGLTIFHIDDTAGYNTEGYPGQGGWPENGNHYRIAVLQADGLYDLEQNVNRGDAGDVYHSGGVSSIGPNSVPNTHAYQGGSVFPTFISISNISAASPSMSFDVALGEDLSVTPLPGLASSGDAGGPFVPPSEIYTLENTGGVSLDWTASKVETWFDLSAIGGTLAPAATTTVTVSLNANADLLAPGSYSDSVTFTNVTSGVDQFRSVHLTVAAVFVPPADALVWDSFDADPGWTTTGEWAFGAPTGQGGLSWGFPDPTVGATGANVYGVNLNGDYSLVVGGPFYLTTPAIDLSAAVNTRLQFQRLLNTDFQPWAFATVEVSNDGAGWTPLFDNGFSEITDSAWGSFEYDISSVADRQGTVYVRWGYEIGGGAFPYSGWNLDDFAILGERLYFVDETATAGAQTGMSWADAFLDIQDAVDVAGPAGGGTVLVANGVYGPVVLASDVEVYGGFEGLGGAEETSASQQDLSNLCVIDAAGALHGVTMDGIVNSRLSGFCIIGGNAVGGGLDDWGGGILCNNLGDSDLIELCSVVQNNANLGGGGIMVFNASPSIAGVLVAENTASLYAGGLYIEGATSAPIIVSCSFFGNSAEGAAIGMGGGIMSYLASPFIDGCIVHRNFADDVNGGIWLFGGGTPIIVNSTISANSSAGLTSGLRPLDGVFVQDVAPFLQNNIIAGHAANGGGIAEDGAASDPLDVSGNLFFDNAGIDYWDEGAVPLAGGAAINALPEATATNVDGDPLFVANTTGAWTAISTFNAATGLTTFTDSGGPFVPHHLYRMLNPDTADPFLFVPIVRTTPTTVEAPGDFSGIAATTPFEIVELRLQSVSPAIDVGISPIASSFADVDGEARPFDVPGIGADSTGTEFDIGADEVLDSDADGLLDWLEQDYGTDPLNPDTDGDGLSDGDEVNIHLTDPLNPDTDGDGLSDGDEVNIHLTDPLNPDSDADGLPDGWEVLYGLLPLDSTGINGATGDPDFDDLDNAAEYAAGSNPVVADTDGDGLTDGDEINIFGTDPTLSDTDNDGLSDSVEIFSTLTDPLIADTDGDGVIDGAEINAGTDPLNPLDFVVFYVDLNAVGAGNGLSWTDAYTDIQSGIDDAAALGGAHVWVADGIYNEAIVLSTGVRLLANFEGFGGAEETLADQRDFTRNFTTIDASGTWPQSIMVTEIDPGTPDAIEFTNVTGGAVDLTNWTITVYDVDSFPAALVTITLPSGSISSSGDVFTLTESGAAPGTYPSFFTGGNINWVSTSTTVAVLVQNDLGQIIDFATTGDSTLIADPVSIPSNEWSGAGIATGATTGLTYQRNVASDSGDASDWTIAATSMGVANAGLLPFTPGVGMHAVTMVATSHAVIEGFVITGGRAVGLTFPDMYGGGIFCDSLDGTNIIALCTVTDNEAKYGGGIAVYNASPGIYYTTVERNKAIESGGGIFVGQFSYPYILGVSMTGNSAGDPVTNPFSYGGGILVDVNSWAILDSCTIMGNTAGDLGGGVFFNLTGGTIVNSTISYNEHFYAYSGYFPGDGIWSYASSPQLVNNIVSGNANGGIGECCGVVRPLTVDSNLFDDNNGFGPYFDFTTPVDVLTLNGFAYATGNIQADSGVTPFFEPDVTGTWDAPATFDPATGMTTFTDSTADFKKSQQFITIKPDSVTQPYLWALAVDITPTTVAVVGDLTSIGTVQYALVEAHLASNSPAVDVGSDPFAPVQFKFSPYDIDGDLRPYDVVGVGAEGTDTEYDIGADEIVDTDNDGLRDRIEVADHGTDPLVADTDGDGLSDGDEVNIHATDPLDADTDGDGMDDGWEVLYALLPLDPGDAPLDLDGDGATNLDEYGYGTNPHDVTDNIWVDLTNSGTQSGIPSEPFTTISAGIAVASPAFAVIHVKPGAYFESSINASVKILAEGGPVTIQ